MLLRGGVDLNGRFCTATACFILKTLFGDEDEERVLRVLGGDRDDIGLASIALLRRRSVDFPRFRVAGGTPSERIVLVRTSAEAVGCDRSLGVVRCARGRVDHGGEIIVSDSWSPITLLGHQLCLSIAREIAQTDKGCVTGLKNTFAKVRSHLDWGLC